MNIKKNIVILAILGATSLFAADLKEIDTLIEKINKTEAVEAKQDLMIKLNQKVEKLNRLDVIEAQTLIDQKLVR
ncbi:hypothetical protein ALC152_05540 [Arcobacter sp. 15-2]|uniref:hypothetical protein n=1 Tax=Arcobacter sp. 15-2 TaxID=3374109 RepID=UPI0021C5379F